MSVHTESTLVVESEPYFLGGTHRRVIVNGHQKLSIIPQPSANGVHSKLFEIALISGTDLEVLGAFCTEEEISQIVGEMVLSGRL